MIESIDHVVLSTRDEARCLDFYTRVLGMSVERYGANRLALRFGNQKINVHPPGLDADLKASDPRPGALDLCFIASWPLERVIARLDEAGIPLIAGPVERSGGCGPIRSVYVRDPDGNLVEISEPLR
jgi:catechol 2,3-dioxygenase-like lactoylglutathione lyase family enzyme